MRATASSRCSARSTARVDPPCRSVALASTLWQTTGSVRRREGLTADIAHDRGELGQRGLGQLGVLADRAVLQARVEARRSARAPARAAPVDRRRRPCAAPARRRPTPARARCAGGRTARRRLQRGLPGEAGVLLEPARDRDARRAPTASPRRAAARARRRRGTRRSARRSCRARRPTRNGARPLSAGAIRCVMPRAAQARRTAPSRAAGPRARARTWRRGSRRGAAISSPATSGFSERGVDLDGEHVVDALDRLVRARRRPAAGSAGRTGPGCRAGARAAGGQHAQPRR